MGAIRTSGSKTWKEGWANKSIEIAVPTSGSKTWKEGWANRSIETRAVTTGLKTWKELSLQVKCNLELRDGVEELRGKLRKTDIESGGQLARMNSKLRDA